MLKQTLYVGHAIPRGGGCWERDHVRAVIGQAALSCAIQCYTLQDAVGFWNGEREDTTLVVVVDLDTASAKGLAHEIRRRLKQDAVLLETQEVTTTLVGGQS